MNFVQQIHFFGPINVSTAEMFRNMLLNAMNTQGLKGIEILMSSEGGDLNSGLGQFTRNYTQTVKRAADNKRRYAPGEGSIPPVLLSRVSKGVPPLAHDFACKV